MPEPFIEIFGGDANEMAFNRRRKIKGSSIRGDTLRKQWSPNRIKPMVELSARPRRLPVGLQISSGLIRRKSRSMRPKGMPERWPNTAHARRWSTLRPTPRPESSQGAFPWSGIKASWGGSGAQEALRIQKFFGSRGSIPGRRSQRRISSLQALKSIPRLASACKLRRGACRGMERLSPRAANTGF